VFYEGAVTMGIYHRHDGGASSNYALTKERKEDIDMLEFLRPLFRDKKLYSTTWKKYLEHYYSAFSQLENNSEYRRNRAMDFFKYLTKASFKSLKSDIYFLLLILFNRHLQ